MNPVSGKVKAAIAILVGVVLFTVDLFTRILAALMSGMIGFFLVLFIVGILSGNVKNGLLSVLLLLMVMMPIGIVLYPYLPGMPTTGNHTAMALMLMVALMCRPALHIEGESAAVCCFLVVFVALVAAFAPGLYFVGFLFGGVGGFLGTYLWSLVEKGHAEVRSEAPSSPSP